MDMIARKVKMNSGLSFQSARQKLQADWPLFLVLVLYVAGALSLSHTCLFWDSVSIFAPATYFYENHWHTFSLPPGYVTDNLPLNFVLSIWWYLFGRTLFSTHFLFVVFGCGVIVEIYKLCRLCNWSDQVRKYVFLLAVSDTAVVTQLLVPMFDGVMLFFILWGIRAILEGRNREVAVAMMFLAMLRMRGVLFCGGLALCHWGCWRQLKKTVYCFLPAGLVAIGLLGVQWHLQRGLFGLGADSPWHVTTMRGMVKNTMAFGRFMLENNRFILWGGAAVVGGMGWKQFWRRAHSRQLFLVLAGVFGLCLLMTVPFANPYGPRYFLPFFVLLPCVVGVLVFETLSFRKARWVCLCMAIGLWGGHFWRYPESCPVSWDTTLGHLPYYELRSSMRDYMREQDIRPAEVRSFFPAVKSDYMIDLDGCKEAFVEDERQVCYILYSNVFNLGGAEKAGIGDDWILQRRFAKWGIHMDLYKASEDINAE